MITYAYNTQLVPAADVPKSALDFLKPLFSGKLIATDPGDDDAGFYVFHSHRREIRLGLHGQVHGAEAELRDHGHATVSNAIAAGEMLATFDSTSTTPRLKAQGKPIDLVLSQDDATPLFLVAAPSSRTRRIRTRPSCSSTGTSTPEQQSRTGTFSPRSDVPPPQGWQPLSTYKLDTGYRASCCRTSRGCSS